MAFEFADVLMVEIERNSDLAVGSEAKLGGLVVDYLQT